MEIRPLNIIPLSWNRKYIKPSPFSISLPLSLSLYFISIVSSCEWCVSCQLCAKPLSTTTTCTCPDWQSPPATPSASLAAPLPWLCLSNSPSTAAPALSHSTLSHSVFAKLKNTRFPSPSRRRDRKKEMLFMSALDFGTDFLETAIRFMSEFIHQSPVQLSSHSVPHQSSPS